MKSTYHLKKDEIYYSRGDLFWSVVALFNRF